MIRSELYVETFTDNKVLASYGRKTRGRYRIPALSYNLKILQQMGIVYKGTPPPLRPIRTTHKSLEKLFPYQQEDAKKGAACPFPGYFFCLAPGLGKTATSLVASELAEDKHTLIICPKSLIPTWIHEIRMWCENTDNVAYFLGNPKIDRQHPKHRWVVTNYDFYVNNPVVFSPARTGFIWDTVICDESLLLKNRKTRRFRTAARGLKTTKTWMLSGSPINKYYDDLWTQFYLMWPDVFSSYWRWTREFCEVAHNGFASIIIGNKPIDPFSRYPELYSRRSRKEVLPNLPELIIRNHYVEVVGEQRRLHDEIAHQFITRLESTGDELTVVNKMSAMTRMMQIVSHPVNAIAAAGDIPSAKHEAIISSLESGDAPLPCVIWTHWLPGAKLLARAIKELYPELKIAIANGDDAQAIEIYKAGKIDVLIMSLTVGRYGHTLINTRSVFYLDRLFNPDLYIQSLDRFQRIGLQWSPVVTILDAHGTIDDVVMANLSGKMSGIATITNQDLATMLRGIVR